MASPLPDVLADGWYGALIDSFWPLERTIARWPRWVRFFVGGLGPARGVVLFAVGVRHEVVVMTRADRGWRSLLLLRALFGSRRKLIALHFIDHPPRARGLGRLLDRGWRPVERWSLRRALLKAQVLSEWEIDLYASRFGVEPDRFCFIPFARRGRFGRSVPSTGRSRVVAAGRAYCDWETLFEAAQGRDWPLVVVCGSHDLERVRGLGSAVGTEVLVDVPDERARELLAGAAVSVLPMYDAGISHGQVRLCDAVDAGAAIVASAVRSLEGYVEDGRTAHLVPAGNAGALRAAVEELLRDPAARVALAEAAYERAGAWTWSDYLRAIEEICTRTS